MFSEIKDYKAVFDTLVTKTADYLIQNNIKAQILGISGGIDSTVVAAICYEVSILTGVPLLGRSLPTCFNKVDENIAADLVGKAFCTNYAKIYMEDLYQNTVDFINIVEDNCQTLLANGNIQARLRMIYLYNLAGVHSGIVMDTDNLTENNLGYFTIHGDVGDFNPIGGLWKTEVFELAKWLIDHYKEPHMRGYNEQATAIIMSLNLKPTAGLGITNDDLEELGAESYDQVDTILQEILAWKSFTAETSWNLKNFLGDQQMLNIPIEIIKNVATRHFNSEFKREQLPIKITRETII